ncbi:uncharacterized protein LOC117169865 [Belonocnema kinseyi]|uniref:uncharacterized protein LOC117169865 n=1 Tax=Belonocnema kinseyi TaxID=2817044 RepID=UPI00143DCDA4|nr:uncharacterized protein LOC117169865 [Belonocnema kinseyi]
MTSAIVNVYSNDHKLIRGRALLDTCSSANFVTEKFPNKLGLAKKKCSIPEGAMNDLSTVTKHVVKLKIRSMHNSFEKTLTCLTVPEISNLVPNEILSREKLRIPANVPLADPQFNVPAPVDLLIGAGPTLSMFYIGQIDLSTCGEDLCVQKTRLGWIIGGTPGSSKMHNNLVNCQITELQDSVNRFWEIEEGQPQNHFSAEELECDKHFQQYITRNKSGRYIVALPFKNNKEALGESQSKALKCLKSLFYKFTKNPNLEVKYRQVLDEYVTLNHMTEITDGIDGDGFYLPHHAVIKENSLSTKLRVVFNGSAKTNTGLSLNDKLMVGPTIQSDIVSLILKFRLHNYVITADIEKMYRQIHVRPEDRKYQRILWGT